MSVLQMFRKGNLKVNQFLRAQKTVLLANNQPLFEKGQPYRVISVKPDCITLKGRYGNICRLSAERFVKRPIPWTNFGLIGKKAKAAG